MELETVRRARRVLSAIVAMSAIMLVMARVRTPSAASADTTGTIASVVFLIALVAFAAAWRKEHALAEAAFAERERQQLAALRLQVELAQLAAAKRREANGTPENESGVALGLKGKDVGLRD
jgi:ABC-type transport system involved in cytochrome bd biosynthesis fused ATPase/permease subunit